ncbi:MAG: hypothetical protein Salg2KO_13940 [Salibacteraceae bacterium]
MKKIAIIFGIVAGIVPSAMFWIMNPSGDFSPEQMENGQVIGYVTMLIGFATIFFAVKSYRDNHLGGSIKFGKAFLVGLYITLVASIIYATSWETYISVMDVNFVEAYHDYMKASLESEGKSPEEIDTTLGENAEMMDMYQSNFAFRFLMTLAEIFPVGLIISLISALVFSVILKKEKTATT